MKKLLSLLLLLASPAFGQTAVTYFTSPTVAAIKALTTRPDVIQTTDSNPGIFNWTTTPCGAADDIAQITPTAGPTGCYVRMATPYNFGSGGVLPGANGGTGVVSGGSGTSFLAIGGSALAACSGTDTCGGSTAFGNLAGASMGPDPSRSSVFFGSVAGQWATGGASNTFIGAFAGRGGPSTGALSPTLTGSDNSCLGEAACINIHGVAQGNSGYGFNSLFGLEQGLSNSAYGLGSGTSIVSTNANSLFGVNSYGWGAGSDNVVVGFGAGRGTFTFGSSTGSSAGGQNVLNVADTTPYTVGHTVFSCCTVVGTTISSISAGAPGTLTLSNNLIVTMGSGITVYDITNPHTGVGATLVGYLAGAVIQGTIHPTIVGAQAGNSVTTGANFAALGYFAGSAVTTQNNVTALGASAAQNTTSAGMTAVGASACAGSSGTPLTGGNMVCLGNSAGLVVQGAAANLVLIGTSAGVAITTASAGVYIGSLVASAKTTGANETIVGSAAAQAQITGSGNSIFGASAAGSCTACVDNIVIGRAVDVLAATGTGKLNIGNAIYGTGMSAASGTQKIGINTGADPSYTLDVTGDVNSSTLYRAGGTAGVTCSVAALGATITVKGGIITALTGC